MARKKNLLFVCTANLMRSATAESIFQDHEEWDARGRGTHANRLYGGTQLMQEDIDWADVILCMEHEHLTYILERFHFTRQPLVEVLNIPDEYQFEDPKLIELLKLQTKEIVSYYHD